MAANFYILEPDGLLFGVKYAYADALDPLISGPPLRCPECGSALSWKAWLPPHNIKLSSAQPEKWPDFLWGAGFALMVSKRFRDLYENAGLKGIEHFFPPTRIVRMGRRKAGDFPPNLPEYYLVTLKWNGANLDDEASSVVRKRPQNCWYCRGSCVSFERVVIQEDTWDGSDIFEARGLPGDIVVSERFKQLADTHKITNGVFIPAQKYAHDEHRPGLWYIRE